MYLDNSVSVRFRGWTWNRWSFLLGFVILRSQATLSLNHWTDDPIYVNRDVETDAEFKAALGDTSVNLITLTRSIQLTNDVTVAPVQVDRNLTFTSRITANTPSCENKIALTLPAPSQDFKNGRSLQIEEAVAEDPYRDPNAYFNDVRFGPGTSAIARDLDIRFSLVVTLQPDGFTGGIYSLDIGPGPFVFTFINSSWISDCSNLPVQVLFQLVSSGPIRSEPIFPDRPSIINVNTAQEIVFRDTLLFVRNDPLFIIAAQDMQVVCTSDPNSYGPEGRSTECWRPYDEFQKYNGGINTTRSGRPCRAWAEADPATAYSPLLYARNHLEDNFCRQTPSNLKWGGSLSEHPDTPWCYVEPDDSLEDSGCDVLDPLKCAWERCDVPICDRACNCEEVPFHYQSLMCPTLPVSPPPPLPPPAVVPAPAPAPAPGSVGETDDGGGSGVVSWVAPLLVAVALVVCGGGLLSRAWLRLRERGGTEGPDEEKQVELSEIQLATDGEAGEGERREDGIVPSSFGSSVTGSFSTFTTKGSAKGTSMGGLGEGGTSEEARERAFDFGFLDRAGFDPRSSMSSIDIVSDDEVITLGSLRQPGSRSVGSRSMLGSRPSVGSAAEEKFDVQSLSLDMGEVELTAFIGGGSFGFVYKGLWNGVEVAVKLVEVASTLPAHNRAVKETALAETLRHPNIISTFASSVRTCDHIPVAFRNGTRDVVVYQAILLLEYGEGDLLSAMQQGLLRTPATAPDTARILRLLQDVANGMVYVHTRGIIHADLKPANIFYTWQKHNMVAKIGDFGLSRVFRQVQGGDGGEGGDETGPARGMRVAGTVTHLPPEALQGHGMLPAADVFAFGVVMWELYMQQQPHQGCTEAEMLERIGGGECPLEFDCSVPAEYRQLAERCWARDPVARPSFPEIVEALKPLLEDAPEPAPAAAAAAAAAASASSMAAASTSAALDK